MFLYNEDIHTLNPRLHRQHISHNRLIIPTRHLRRNDTDDHKVQLPHPRILPPFLMRVVSQGLRDIDVGRCHLELRCYQAFASTQCRKEGGSNELTYGLMGTGFLNSYIHNIPIPVISLVIWRSLASRVHLLSATPFLRSLTSL